MVRMGLQQRSGRRTRDIVLLGSLVILAFSRLVGCEEISAGARSAQESSRSLQGSITIAPSTPGPSAVVSPAPTAIQQAAVPPTAAPVSASTPAPVLSLTTPPPVAFSTPAPVAAPTLAPVVTSLATSTPIIPATSIPTANPIPVLVSVAPVAPPSAPPTSATVASPTPGPLVGGAPPTSAPPTSAPPTSAPPTSALPTSAPISVTTPTSNPSSAPVAAAPVVPSTTSAPTAQGINTPTSAPLLPSTSPSGSPPSATQSPVGTSTSSSPTVMPASATPGASSSPSTAEAPTVTMTTSPVVQSSSPTLAPETAAPFAPSTCTNGIAGVDGGGGVCCKEQCGTCGGVGCSSIPGTTSADCCPSEIIAAGVMCGEAPCIMEGFTPSPVNPANFGTAAPVQPSFCSNGQPGYQDGDVCCLEACGRCGGEGCGTIPGTGGAEFCCPNTIRANGTVCGEAPCVIEGYTPAPAVVGGGTAAPAASSNCTNGFPGIQDGSVCCEANCGQCGGIGCGTVPGTGGQDSCCSSIIEANGQLCDDTGEAPCIIAGFTPSPVSAYVGTAAPVYPSNCSNGIPGYQDLDVCCLESCGRCGGYGCSNIPGTGGAENCCSSTIRETGQACSETVVAPCIIEEWTPSPVNPAFVGTSAPFEPSMCAGGTPGVQNGAACCRENCGQCGGIGCGTIPGTGGAGNCCASQVISANQICAVNGREAPCVIEGYTPSPAVVPGTLAPFENSTCSNGFDGVQDEDVCCSMGCGQCGGDGCGTIPGTGGSDACCSSDIRSNGTACSIKGSAPCYLDNWTPSPTLIETAAPVQPSNCSNGLAGYQDGQACCKMICGQCGGIGCGTISGTNGSSDCCSSTILTSNIYCEDGVEAPCIIIETAAPTPSPALTSSPTEQISPGSAAELVNAADGRFRPSVALFVLSAMAAVFLGAVPLLHSSVLSAGRATQMRS